MTDFKFNCPHCKQPLEAPSEMLGQQVNCPSCNGMIDLPIPMLKQVVSDPSTQQPATRACQFCGEQILLSAIKCKHCGEFIDCRKKQAIVSVSKKTDFFVEKEIWSAAPSYLFYIQFFISFLLPWPVYYVFNCPEESAEADFFFTTVLLSVLGGWLIISIYAFLDRKTRVYTVTNKRVISKAGIISRQVHEVVVRDIRAINIKQNTVERLLGLGTVEVGSAGTAANKVRFFGIVDPSRVRDMIRFQKDVADEND